MSTLDIALTVGALVTLLLAGLKLLGWISLGWLAVFIPLGTALSVLLLATMVLASFIAFMDP